jgi:ABC-type transporter Mla subunit MlaD
MSVISQTVAQHQTVLEAQNKITHDVVHAIDDAERKLFQADRNLNQFVDALEDAEVVLSVQKELDKDRCDYSNCKPRDS